MTRGVDGLLLVDKPEGPTSHDIVNRARKLLGQRRIGHAGTLDPMASGLLPLLVGRATRLLRFLPGNPKRYDGTLVLGLTTDSDDVTGTERCRHDGPLPGATAVLEAASRFTGTLQQVPPAISARKVDGKRLYRLARQGKAVEAPPAEVEVTRWDLRPTADEGVWAFEAEVSGGTYIRSLARDLGAVLGCGGALASLRRIGVGCFDVRDAIRLPAPDDGDSPDAAESIVPLADIPLDLPEVVVDAGGDVRRFLAGGEIAGPEGPEGPVQVRSGDRALLGIGARTGLLVRPRVVLADPAEAAPDRLAPPSGV